MEASQILDIEEKTLAFFSILRAKRKAARAASPQHSIPVAVVQEHVQTNRRAIVLASASVLVQIQEYKDGMERNNYLKAVAPEFHDNLLNFLNNTKRDIEALNVSILNSEEIPTEEEAQEMATYANKLLEHAKEWIEARKDPKVLVDFVMPTGIILTCGSIGAAIGGGVIGFGVGSMFGRMMSGLLKPEETSKQIEKLFKDD